MPFQTIRHDIRNGGGEFRVNVLGNLAAFAPMGVLMPMLMGRRSSALRVGAMSFGLSLLIESLQGCSGRRVADVDDLMLNTLGGLIGFGGWVVARRLLRAPTPGG